MQSTLEKVKSALLHADKKQAVTEEIKKQTKPSIVESLYRGMEEQRKRDSESRNTEKAEKTGYGIVRHLIFYGNRMPFALFGGGRNECI